MSLEKFKNFRIYRDKALLAIDFGLKNIGLATFVPGRDPWPLGHGSLDVRKDTAKALRPLMDVIASEEIHAIIMGLPLLADGSEGKMAVQIRHFAKELQAKSSLPILFQDEYLSSYSAQEKMKLAASRGFPMEDQNIHTESAKIILEDFIRAEGL
ncbi:MAG: Holliday junction resolvase RuvX [Bacteriovoracales bacterium]|nr:Holliday junction resolvase RuvX [Bacteriovoracales bacterium]